MPFAYRKLRHLTTSHMEQSKRAAMSSCKVYSFIAKQEQICDELTDRERVPPLKVSIYNLLYLCRAK